MKDKLKKIINQKVIKSSSGGGAGSNFLVEFEDKSYFFIYCSWRIEKYNEVIVTSNDTIVPSEYTDSPNGLIGKKAPILEGRELKNTHLTPQYDLEMIFDEGYKLKIFCDVGRSSGDYINWEYNIPKDRETIEITSNFKEKICDNNFDGL